MNTAISATENAADCAEHWYVLRFLYRDQPKVRAQLEENGIKIFSPKKLVVKIKNGKKIKVWQPIIWDLLFVHSSRKELDPYVAVNDYFQYKYKVGGKYCEPLTVPEKQMNDFIRAVESSENPLYFSPQELDLTKGTRVRLIGGYMDGYEGIIMKVKGARARRLIVEIPDTMIAAVEVEPDLIEILK